MKDIDIQSLARDLASYRRAKELTLCQMAGWCLVSRATLSRIERGGMPGLHAYLKLCKAMGVSADFYYKQKPK